MDGSALALLSIILSTFLSIFLFFKGYKSPLSQERFKKVIDPVFEIIEPYLFQKISTETLKAVNEISRLIYLNKMLSGRKILFYLEMCTKAPKDKDSYFSLCQHINIEYDKYCKALGIPLRPFLYRFKNRQYKSKFVVVMYFLGFIILALLIVFACLLAIIAGIAVIVTVFKIDIT